MNANTTKLLMTECSKDWYL